MWALHNRKSDGSRAAWVRIVAAWDRLRLPEVRPQTNLSPEGALGSLPSADTD
jgi:hypothetical protein